MTKLTAKARKALPKNEFALPGKKKFPVDTPVRAANAKARATQAVKKGKMSKGTEAKIDAKANAKLGKKKTVKPPARTLAQRLAGAKL